MIGRFGKYTYLLYDRSFKEGPKDATAGVFVFLKGNPIGGLDCNEPVDPMAKAVSASFIKVFSSTRFPILDCA
jgi:hypothetical protein